MGPFRALAALSSESELEESELPELELLVPESDEEESELSDPLEELEDDELLSDVDEDESLSEDDESLPEDELEDEEEPAALRFLAACLVLAFAALSSLSSGSSSLASMKAGRTCRGAFHFVAHSLAWPRGASTWHLWCPVCTVTYMLQTNTA